MRNLWRSGIVKNITWLTGASILVKPIWLVFVIVLCWRVLQTEGYGVFSTALWLAFIPASLTDLGLIQFTVRDVARSTRLASRYFSNILVFKLSIAPLAVAVALGVGLILGYDPPMLVSVAWASAYATALSLMQYCRAFFRAYQNLRLEAISLILEKGHVFLMCSIALYTIGTPSATLAFMALGMVATLALAVLWINNNLARLDLRLIGSRFIKAALKGAIPLGLFSFFIVVYARAGGVLLEYWHGESAAGEFAPALRITEALALLPAVFAAAMLPRLSQLYEGSITARFRSEFRQSLLAATGLAIVAAAAVSALAPTLITLVNPEDPGNAASILRVFVWAFPLMTMKDLVIIALVATDRHRFLAGALAFTTTVSLALDFWLVRALASDGLIIMFFVVEALIILVCGWRYMTDR